MNLTEVIQYTFTLKYLFGELPLKSQKKKDFISSSFTLLQQKKLIIAYTYLKVY